MGDCDGETLSERQKSFPVTDFSLVTMVSLQDLQPLYPFKFDINMVGFCIILNCEKSNLGFMLVGVRSEEEVSVCNQSCEPFIGRMAGEGARNKAR